MDDDWADQGRLAKGGKGSVDVACLEGRKPGCRSIDVVKVERAYSCPQSGQAPCGDLAALRVRDRYQEAGAQRGAHLWSIIER